VPVAGRDDAQILEPIEHVRNAVRSEHDGERIRLIALVNMYEVPCQLVLGVVVLALSELEQARLVLIFRSHLVQALLV
jgi:hypothetical protein